MMKFLRSDTAQSTLRIIVFMIAVMVCLNLLAVPILIALALTLSQDLSWVGPYVTALAAVGGAGILGKALQKKYEGVASRIKNIRRSNDEEVDRHM